MNQLMVRQPHDSAGLRSSARDSTTRRRNLIVLGMLLAFVAFAFTLSFSHVAREVGGSSRKI